MRHITVIIAGFKNTARLTLETVLKCRQSHEVDFEVIFADNTPNARHRDMVAAVGSTERNRVRYLSHTVPGKSAAQNAALKVAEGDYVICLDDDVLPDQNLILEYDRAFQTHNCAAVQGKVELMFEGCQPPAWLSRDFRLALAEMDFGPPQIPFDVGLTGASMAFRADVFRKYGLFDERLGPAKTGTLEDQEFSERIRRAGEVQLFWPTAVVKHRIPPRRLRVASFCSICYDVGYSDFLLSGHMVKVGRVKFSAWSAVQIAKGLAQAGWLLTRGRIARGLRQFCLCWQTFGYWRQGMIQMPLRQVSGASLNSAVDRVESSQENGTG